MGEVARSVRGVLLLAAVAIGTASAAGGAADRMAPKLEVVATGVTRPIQLAMAGRTLIVLSPGSRGDTAGELHHVDLDRSLPVDLTAEPRLRIPFADARTATLGSLARHPARGDLYLGEENGARIWLLGPDRRLTLFGTGLRRLSGGSALLVDGRGRLVVVDWVDPTVSPDEERAPPGLEHLREEDYRGPLVLRLDLDPTIPLPRRLERLAPLFPRGWGGPAGGAMFPRLVAVAALGGDDLAVLSSSGDLYRIGSDRRLVPFTELPRGQYVRVNMVSAPGGGLYVSSGFWVTRLFHVNRDGVVTTLAEALADPQGLTVDVDGSIYLAESALHRIVRLKPDY
jgi:hypothetical protein